MGFDTLYYFMSITLLFGSIALVWNMLFYRKTSRNIFGQKVTKKHPAYKSMQSFTSNKNITIGCAAIVIFALNVCVDITRLRTHHHSSDVELLIWIAPCINVVALIVVFSNIKKKIIDK